MNPEGMPHLTDLVPPGFKEKRKQVIEEKNIAQAQELLNKQEVIMRTSPRDKDLNYPPDVVKKLRQLSKDITTILGGKLPKELD